MCCAVTALVFAVMAAWRRLLRAASGGHRGLRWVAAVVAALAVGIGTAAAAQHLGHYATRAETNQRSVFAEILAQPICSGDPVSSVVEMASRSD